MRTVSPTFQALSEANQKKISGYVVFRDPRMLFTAADYDEGEETPDSIFDHDCTVLTSGSAVLRVVRSAGLELLHSKWVDGVPAAWTAQDGFVLSGSSSVGIEEGRVWFVAADNGIYYADWGGSAFGAATQVLDADAVFGTTRISLAPVADDVCYLQIGPLASPLEHANLYRLTLSGSGYELDQFHGSIYSDGTTQMKFDACRLAGVDYVFAGDRDNGRYLYCSVQGDVWSELRQVMPLDVVDSYSNFSLGGVQVIDGKIFASGLFKRGDATHPTRTIDMNIFLMGDGHNFSMARDLFITKDLSADVGGKLMLLDDQVFFVGYGGYAVADATTRVGYSNPNRESTCTDVYSVDMSASQNSAAQLSLELSRNVVFVENAGFRRGAEAEVYATLYSGSVPSSCLMGTFGIDMIAEADDEGGQTRQIGARGLGIRKVDQWTSDQSYDFWSQTRSIQRTPEDLKELTHVDGIFTSGSSLWTGGSSALMLDELNTDGYLYSVERAVRGGEVRAKFVVPSPDGSGSFAPRYGVGLCYYRESRYEAATRLGIDSEDVTEDQYGNYGLFAIAEGGAVQIFNVYESIETAISGSAAIGVDPEEYHWLQFTFQDGYCRVCVRADTATDWTELIETRFEDTNQPWFRDDIGRAVLYINNVTPYSETPGFSSDQDIIPVEDVSVFPESGRVIVDEEQITYSGSASFATKPATMVACDGQYFEEAPHENAYWVDGVIATVPYDSSDIHIGNLDYDQTSQYLIYGKSRPHALDRIDYVRVRVWKEERLPNAVYAMQRSSGKFWRCDDITVGSPTWTQLTAPAYSGTLESMFLHPLDPSKLILATQDSSAGANSGPRIYEVTGLSGAALTSSEIWGAADGIAYIGGNHERTALNLFWSRELGQFIGTAKPSTIGASGAYIWGDSGAWNGTAMATSHMHGACQGSAKVISPAGSGVLVAAGAIISRAGTVTPGSSSWSNKYSFGYSAWGMISDGLNCIWADNYTDINNPTLWHHDNLVNPPSGLHGSAVDISPTVDGFKYVPANGSYWWQSRNLLDAGNILYMLGKKRGGSTYKLFSKATWDQTPDDWAEVYDFSGYALVGTDVHVSNTMKMVGKTQLASNNGQILYSEDGGNSWTDKTGSWNGDKQQAAQFAFATGSAVVT